MNSRRRARSIATQARAGSPWRRAVLAALLGIPLALGGASAAMADATWDALQSAFASATTGTTITLDQDVTGDPGEGLVVPNGVSLTLDLAGHSLDVDASGAVGVAAIQVVGTGTSLTIEDSSADGTGHLLARADPNFGNGGAGIGAPGATPGTGSVTITGGTVEAYGGYQAAGIGGANYPGGTVTVTGGEVTAVGGSTGSGIGGGWSGGGGTLAIGGTPYPVGQVADGGGSPSSGGAPITTIAGTPGIEYLATRAGAGNSIHIQFGHTLGFDAAGGSPTPGQQFIPVRAATTEPAAPTRIGYDFAGWYDDPALTAAHEFATPLTATMTVTAKWAPILYALRYDLAGGALATAEPASYDITSPAFTLADPTRTGYAFAGWTGTGLGTATTPVEISLGSTGDRAYTATWAVNEYVASFASNGGTAVPSVQIAYGQPVPEPAAPTRAGYRFDRWYRDAGLANAYDFDSPMGAAPLTLYAGWTADQPDPTPVPTTQPTTPPSPAPAPIVTPDPTPTPSETPTPAPVPTITAAPPSAAPPTSAPDLPTPPAGDGARPSTLTDSTLTFAELGQLPDRLPLAIAATIVWILLLVFLVRTLADTLRDRLEHWSERFGRQHPQFARRVRTFTGWINGTGPLPIAITFAASSLVMWAIESGHGSVGLEAEALAVGPLPLPGGAEAGGGFEEGLRVLGSSAVAVLVITVVTRVLTAVIARTAWGIRATPHASGWAVVIGLLGLALSRALDFIPGLLEGSSMSLRRDPGTSEREFARVEALHGWVSLGLSLLGWIGANLVPGEGGWPVLLVHDTLVAIAVAGLGSLLVELMPLRTLAGGAIWAHARRQWVALAILTGLGFVLIVVPDASNWLAIHDSVVRWVAIAVAFAVAAVVVVLVLNVRAARAHEQSEEE